MTNTKPDRLRLAELTTGMGAAVVGIGLGALLADRLAGSGPAILVLGIALHAWGLIDKHRQERSQGAVDPWWASVLYWACGIGLAGMLAWIMIRS